MYLGAKHETPPGNVACIYVASCTWYSRNTSEAKLFRTRERLAKLASDASLPRGIMQELITPNLLMHSRISVHPFMDHTRKDPAPSPPPSSLRPRRSCNPLCVPFVPASQIRGGGGKTREVINSFESLRSRRRCASVARALAHEYNSAPRWERRWKGSQKLDAIVKGTRDT